MLNNNTKSFISPIQKWCSFAFIVICLTSFANDERIHKLAQQTQQKLSSSHGIEPESLKIKKCEITISDEGFLRYRKYYLNGKQEYYSFNLSRLKTIDYFGDTNSGNFVIHTLEDDVIVQTYNDRSGNVDSMSVKLTIQLKAIEPQDLIDLQQNLFEMKQLIGQE
jgi:hypothetical protein